MKVGGLGWKWRLGFWVRARDIEAAACDGIRIRIVVCRLCDGDSLCLQILCNSASAGILMNNFKEEVGHHSENHYEDMSELRCKTQAGNYSFSLLSELKIHEEFIHTNSWKLFRVKDVKGFFWFSEIIDEFCQASESEFTIIRFIHAKQGEELIYEKYIISYCTFLKNTTP